METLSWIALTLCVLLLLAWYLSYSAARLDRLHAKVEGALSALDAHVAGVDGQRKRLGRGKAVAEAPVDEQRPHIGEGHLVLDEVLDVDTAVA